MLTSKTAGIKLNFKIIRRNTFYDIILEHIKIMNFAR